MARNAGLQLARAPAVMFLDDDDRLRPHALECLHAALGAEPSVVASVGARHRFRPGGPGVRINHPTRPMVRGVLPELLLGWSTISGQNLFRTEQVRTVGGYRDRPPAEDRRLLLNLAVRGPFALVPEVVHDYRVHDGQTPLPARSPLRERVFWDFVVGSSGRRRLRWIRLWRAGRIWRWAEWRRERGQGTIALVGYASAALLAPALLGSPILRPLFLWQVRDALRSALSRPATSDRGR
jgi:glycosyltransferase involved in cell wall biosynthesis